MQKVRDNLVLWTGGEAEESSSSSSSSAERSTSSSSASYEPKVQQQSTQEQVALSEEQRKNGEKMDRILLLQNVDGSWNWSEELEEFIGKLAMAMNPEKVIILFT